MKNDAASTATAIVMVFKFNVSRIYPPGRPDGILQGERGGR